MNRAPQRLLAAAAIAGILVSTHTAAAETVILTPKPGPEPRINGPKVYGCRPGRPLLYRIPCTGQRPITFSAEDLPDSVQLDAATGIISGRAPKDRGEYAVTLKAASPHGRVAGGKSLEHMQKPYRKMGDILKRLDRDVVFNLCQYGMGDVWTWAGEVGDARKQGEGHPTTLTPNEQYSYMSMWCLMAAPLIFSGDMAKLDDFTLNVLCNAEVIEIDQDSLGKQASIRRRPDEDMVMVKPLEDGSLAVGLFNLDQVERKITINWSDLDISGESVVRDLWRQKDLGAFDRRWAAFRPCKPGKGIVDEEAWCA